MLYMTLEELTYLALPPFGPSAQNGVHTVSHHDATETYIIVIDMLITTHDFAVK